MPFRYFGRGDGIRTHDLLVPNLVVARKSSKFCLRKTLPHGGNSSSQKISLRDIFGSPEITLARLASGPNKKGRQKPSSFGRGDGIRTHDLLVPNQARYQLRYASVKLFWTLVLL